MPHLRISNFILYHNLDLLRAFMVINLSNLQLWMLQCHQHWSIHCCRFDLILMISFPTPGRELPSSFLWRPPDRALYNISQICATAYLIHISAGPGWQARQGTYPGSIMAGNRAALLATRIHGGFIHCLIYVFTNFEEIWVVVGWI